MEPIPNFQELVSKKAHAIMSAAGLTEETFSNPLGVPAIEAAASMRAFASGMAYCSAMLFFRNRESHNTTESAKRAYSQELVNALWTMEAGHRLISALDAPEPSDAIEPDQSPNDAPDSAGGDGPYSI